MKLRFFDLILDQAGFNHINLYATIEYDENNTDDFDKKYQDVYDAFNNDKFDDGMGLPYFHTLLPEDELTNLRNAINKELEER